MSTFCKHGVHVCHVAGVPVADVQTGGDDTAEHAAHVRHFACISVAEVVDGSK